MAISDLPAVNATLNALSAVFLLSGYVLIKRGERDLHKKCMLAALGSSALFLTSYLVYHYNIGSRPFPGTGAIRTVYLTILFTHIVLAVVILPLVLVTTFRGLRGEFGRHVKVARWTFPLWMYVSVTGVIVYVMLYQMY